jgi:hypothetical protein
MEVGGKRCNAGSILELLVTVGSQPHQKRFLFRGDERPVRDIQRLFAAELGERGLDLLPPSSPTCARSERRARRARSVHASAGARRAPAAASARDARRPRPRCRRGCAGSSAPQSSESNSA